MEEIEIEIDADLWEKIKGFAEKEGISLQQWVGEVVRKYLEKSEKQKSYDCRGGS